MNKAEESAGIVGYKFLVRCGGGPPGANNKFVFCRESKCAATNRVWQRRSLDVKQIVQSWPMKDDEWRLECGDAKVVVKGIPTLEVSVERT